MRTLVFDRENNRVLMLVDSELCYNFGSTDCAFGNFLYVVEQAFSDDNVRDSESLTTYFKAVLAEETKAKDMWGIPIKPAFLFALNDFFEGRDKIALSLEEVERFRIRYNLNLSSFPLRENDYSKGMQFKNITSALEISYAFLYYYAYHKFKLVKCEHCGKWFATVTIKKKYCSRNSPYPGYTHLKCEQAVRNILQQCGRIKNRIGTKASATVAAQLHRDSFLNEFYRQCEPFYTKAKEKASIENLENYLSFLSKTEKERGWIQ